MRDEDTILVPAVLPMRPHDYLRRRRLLSGKTISEAGRPFWHRPEHRADVEKNLRTFEQPGVVMKPYLLTDVRRAYDFDAEVYRHLQDLPIFHPRLCRCCGSTQEEPRENRDGGAASLDEEGICTACNEDMVVQLGHRWAA